MTTQAIEIVTPTSSDAEAMASISHDFWREAREAHGARALGCDYVYNHDLTQMRLLLEEPDGQYLRVVRSGGHAAGILCARPYDDQFGGATLDLLALRRPFRGQGIGARLVSEFVAWVPPELPVGVIPYGPKQDALERFYERLGFFWSEADADYMVVQSRGAR